MSDRIGGAILVAFGAISVFVVGYYERRLSLASVEKKELIEKNRKMSELYQKTKTKLEQTGQQVGFCRDINKKIGTKTLEIIAECKDIIENKKNCRKAEFLERNL